MAASGLVGGPFRSSSKVVRLTNKSSNAASIDWETIVSEDWVSASPGGGPLAGGQSVSVTVSINDKAIQLGRGCTQRMYGS